MTDSLPPFSRLWFAWVCFFRVLFDGEYALRAFRARDPDRSPAPEPGPPGSLPEADTPPVAALQLLALLQREGRLVDFVQQDIATFDDAEVGAAARVVHEGCRRALAGHGDIVPIRPEDEGSRITLDDYDAHAVKLTGNVQGSPPFAGVLRHRGWRAESFELPQTLQDHDPQVLAPAEVEL